MGTSHYHNFIACVLHRALVVMPVLSPWQELRSAFQVACRGELLRAAVYLGDHEVEVSAKATDNVRANPPISSAGCASARQCTSSFPASACWHLVSPERATYGRYHSATDGVSDPGEVQAVEFWGIQSLSCHYYQHPTGIVFSPRGVVFRGGTTRPTYDWIAPSR